MGILVIPIRIDFVRRFIAIIAIQATVPMAVAVREDANAMSRVLKRARSISSFWNRETYQFKVNPPHFALVLLLLKERTIKVPMGAYRKRIIKAMYIFFRTDFTAWSPPLLYQI